MLLRHGDTPLLRLRRVFATHAQRPRVLRRPSLVIVHEVAQLLHPPLEFGVLVAHGRAVLLDLLQLARMLSLQEEILCTGAG